LPYTQGTVESIDHKNGRVSMIIHKGYPDLSDDVLTGSAHVFSPETLDWVRDAPDLYADRGVRIVTPRQAMLEFSPAELWRLEFLNVGDYLVLDYRHRYAIRMDRCSNVTAEGLTFYSAPGIAIQCRFMKGDNRFSYIVTRGEIPDGAKVPRLLSTSADAFNYAYARKGPLLENCDFSFMGDDSVNLHGVAFPVVQVEGKRVWVARPHGPEGFDYIVSPGDEVRALKKGNFDVFGTTRLIGFTTIKEDSPELRAQLKQLFPHVKKQNATVYEIELESALPVAKGDFLEIPKTNPSGYVIRNNFFHQHRARGLRLMSSDGLVENNVIEDVKQAAIALGPEFAYWREAGWINNVTVRGNTIRRVAFDPGMRQPNAYTPGAISIYYRPEDVTSTVPETHHCNIEIYDNTINGSGVAAIHVNQADGVKIEGNEISDCNQSLYPANSSLALTGSAEIGVNNSTNVVIKN
jgi:hypothetical protein